jgi:hypothetical protein
VCSACAALGIAVCLHLSALDADHAQHYDTHPIVMTASLPPHPDDGPHKDVAGVVRIVDVNVTVSGTSSGGPPPGRNMLNDTSDWIARHSRQHRRHPAIYAPVLLSRLTPDVISTSTSS